VRVANVGRESADSRPTLDFGSPPTRKYAFQKSDDSCSNFPLESLDNSACMSDFIIEQRL